MNAIGVNKNVHFNIKNYLSAFKIEPILYKFVSIIQSTDCIKKACQEQRLVSWLNCDVPSNVKEYRAVVFPALGLNYHCSLNTFKERTDIAKKYAKILEQYSPDDKGEIKQKFNYFHLVSVIKEVFDCHMIKDEDLFDSGLEILLDKKIFYAKVDAQQIYIFSDNYELLGDGAYGMVGEVYEIASQQLLALKWAPKEWGKTVKRINREISVLKTLHAKVDFEGYSVTGLQDPPLATFYLPELRGYLGTKLGIDLLIWCKKEHSNEDRIAMCKSIIATFINVSESGYWHGDIKLENLLLGKNGVVFIDWDGSIPKYASSIIERPHAVTPRYISLRDLENLELIEDEYDESGMTDDLRLRYADMANSSDLFSIAIVLFYVLVSKDPFDFERLEEYDAEFPTTHKGIHQESWEALIEKKYDWKIVLTIAGMLRWNPSDRPLLQEVIDFWRKI